MNSFCDIRIFLGLVPKESYCNSTYPKGPSRLLQGEPLSTFTIAQILNTHLTKLHSEHLYD